MIGGAAGEPPPAARPQREPPGTLTGPRIPLLAGRKKRPENTQKVRIHLLPFPTEWANMRPRERHAALSPRPNHCQWWHGSSAGGGLSGDGGIRATCRDQAPL